jgi:hypothetical protein
VEHTLAGEFDRLVDADGAWVTGLPALSNFLTGSPQWANGALRAATATRIGAEYGMSGRIYRVRAETRAGQEVSFVLKVEPAEAFRAALGFHVLNGEQLSGSVPACLGGEVLGDDKRGLLVLEDVAPARQGDILAGCDDAEAEAVMRALAKVHAGTKGHAGTRPANGGQPSEGLPRWEAQVMHPIRWAQRLACAAERFPTILTAECVERLGDLPREVADAREHLLRGPVTWIQDDAHLDNVLWRPDGSAVLLDWSRAVVGPAAVDLASILAQGLDSGSPPTRRRHLVDVYRRALEEHGVGGVSSASLESAVTAGLLPWALGAVGWAGREEPDPAPRWEALCAHQLRNVCAWLMP